MQNNSRIVFSLAGIGALGCLLVGGTRAVAQDEYEGTQYPQYVQYPEGAPPVTPGVPAQQAALSPDEIDQLVGPIALYPDPLLSLIFTASTYPQDVLAAEQWLNSAPSPTEESIEAQSWDPSVKGLVHYPTVLKMLSDQIDWTNALGAAFLNQQADVLASVQRLRAQANAAGNLQSNSQEQIVEDGSAIRIEPVDPNVIYVPQYDASAVYAGSSPIIYGPGYPIGLWDDDDFDWGNGYIVVGGGWYRGWHHPEAWDRNPPAWDRHPEGWRPEPARWNRAPRGVAPSFRPDAIARLGLDRRGPAGRPVVVPGRAPVGRQETPERSRSAFDPAENRADVQREQARARPVPAPRIAPQRIEAPRVAPAPREVPRQAPAPAPRPAPQRAAPPAERPNAFGGGGGRDTRAQSARGHASAGRR